MMLYLFKLIIATMISVNLSSATFLISPQSRVASPEVILSDRWQARYASEADLVRGLVRYKETGNPNYLFDAANGLSRVAATNRGAFEGLRRFIEKESLSNERLFTFDEDLISYSRPFERGGDAFRIELVVRRGEGVRVREAGTGGFAFDETASRLSSRLPLSTITGALKDPARTAKAHGVLSEFRNKSSYWTLIDAVVSYGGSNFLELLFEEDPSLFLKFIDGYGKKGIDGLDAICDSVLLAVRGEKAGRLKDAFSTFCIFARLSHHNLKWSFISDASEEGLPRPHAVLLRQASELLYYRLALDIKALGLLEEAKNPDLNDAQREELRGSANKMVDRAISLQPESRRLISEHHKWVFEESFAARLTEGPLMIEVKEGASVSFSHLMQNKQGIMGEVFEREWPSVRAIIERNHIGGISFEASPDEEHSKEAVLGLLNFLFDAGNSDADLRRGVSLGRGIRAQVTEGNRLGIFRVDPYDDRLSGDKAYSRDALKPAVIYLSTYFEKDGTYRFRNDTAALAGLVKDVMPYVVVDIEGWDEARARLALKGAGVEVAHSIPMSVGMRTAQDAIKEMYDYFISAQIASPSNGKIPLVIPEGKKTEVMGREVPERALLLMVREPGEGEAAAYKTYRFITAILYGTGMEELKDIIIEYDADQREALDGIWHLTDKGTRKILITPIKAGPTYLQHSLGIRQSS